MEALCVVVGLAGVVLVLVAYGLLATGRLAADSVRYQWFNVIGTTGILVSLLEQWNVAAFIANLAWISIGIAALVRIHRAQRTGGTRG